MQGQEENEDKQEENEKEKNGEPKRMESHDFKEQKLWTLPLFSYVEVLTPYVTVLRLNEVMGGS